MMSHLALSRMKNGCDVIPVGAWKGFVEEGIDTVWDLTHGAETWAARKAQKKSDVAEIRISNSAMKTSIYYFCIAYLICSKTKLRIQ